jgi:hypothetical protein
MGPASRWLTINPSRSRRIYLLGLALGVAAISGCSLGGPGPMPVLTKSQQIQQVKTNENLLQNNPKIPAALNAQESAMYQRQLNDIQAGTANGPKK